jgi:hypothetical protein
VPRLRTGAPHLGSTWLAAARRRGFKLSTDPKFLEKLRDVVGLYVDPPAHAVVLSVDEKSPLALTLRNQWSCWAASIASTNSFEEKGFLR